MKWMKQHFPILPKKWKKSISLVSWDKSHWLPGFTQPISISVVATVRITDAGYSDAGYSDSLDIQTPDIQTRWIFRCRIFRLAGYSDTGYSDTGYSDTGYSDTGYSDTGYSDTGYSDTGYSDTPDIYGPRNTMRKGILTVPLELDTFKSSFTFLEW